MQAVTQHAQALYLAEDALTQGHNVLVIGSSYGPLLRLGDELEGSAYASVPRVREHLLKEWQEGTRRVLLYTAAAARQDASHLAGSLRPLTVILLDRDKADGMKAIQAMVRGGTLPLLRLLDLQREAIWIWRPLKMSTLTIPEKAGQRPLLRLEDV